MSSRITFKIMVGIILLLVLLIVEFPLFMLLGPKRLILVELTLSCVAAILAFLCCGSMDKRDDNRVVFGLPLALLGLLCFSIQLIINTISAVIGNAAELIAYILSVITLLTTSALLFMTSSTIHYEQDVEESAKQRRSQVDGWQQTLALLQVDCDDQLAETIATVEEQLRFTSPISNKRTCAIDNQIDEEISRLVKDLSDTTTQHQSGIDSCARLLKLIRARNDAAKA